MGEKEIKINVPAGYVIDKENSTFECIRFKKKKSRFSDYDGSYDINGFYIGEGSVIKPLLHRECNGEHNKNVFVLEGATKSALAFAQITQIREHETDRYGYKPDCKDTNGVYIIFYDVNNEINIDILSTSCSRLESYLAFETKVDAELFLKENTQLVKDYFMMD